MAAITAALVGELRAKTDAPMMECKKALTEAEGDMVRAEEILRVKLGSKASKASSRITSEGVVATYIAGGIGALVEINCETDFVTKNDEFIALANAVAKVIAEKNPADLAALAALPLGEKTVEETRTELIGRIGENMSIRRFQRFETTGKPADIVAKMVDGSVQKYLKEVSLFNQSFVKNDKQTVEQMLKAANTSVKSFSMFVVGEGIEKKQDDFAAEVAAQVAAAKQAQ